MYCSQKVLFWMVGRPEEAPSRRDEAGASAELGKTQKDSSRTKWRNNKTYINAKKITRVNSLQNQHLLFAQRTLFLYTIAIYNFCTHNCKGYPDKKQIFHNTNGTKYNTKIEKKKIQKWENSKKTNMTKYKRRKDKLPKYNCNKIQIEKNAKRTKYKWSKIQIKKKAKYTDWSLDKP